MKRKVNQLGVKKVAVTLKHGFSQRTLEEKKVTDTEGEVK